MSENVLGLITSSKVIWLAVFVFLYQSGGIYGKWKRRFVGSSWMMAGIAFYCITGLGFI